jgi:DNA polymerase III sliding clamp (beta) subunit (PCNA family)
VKISILQDNLKRALDCMVLVANPKSRLPILANVLIDAGGSCTQISATNLETRVTCQLGAKVENAGAITVPADTMRDWVSTLPDDRVDLELNDKTQVLTAKCIEAWARFKGIDAQEFPISPVLPRSDTFCDDTILAALRACKAVKQANKYADWQEVIQVEVSKDTLVLTALNDTTKTRQVVPLSGEIEPRSGYAPRGMMDILIRVVTASNKGRDKYHRAEVEVATSDKGIAFTVKSGRGFAVTVYADWQDVKFPDTSKSEPVSTFTVNAPALVESPQVLKPFSNTVAFRANGHLEIRTAGTPYLLKQQRATALLTDQDGYAHKGKNCKFTANIGAVLAAIGKANDTIELGYAESHVQVKYGDSVSMFAVEGL